MVPTMACALLMLMAFSHDGVAPGRPMPGVLRLSNQGYADYVTGDAQTAQNHVASVTFDWTNPSFSKLITHFTPTTNLTN
jgi:hypothetical protein